MARPAPPTEQTALLAPPPTTAAAALSALSKPRPHDDPPSAPPEKKRMGPLDLPTHNKVLLLTGVWLATALASLNMTMVATLMSSISSSFGASNQSAWLGTSFLLATTAFTPLYGRLCNILGRKWANLTALCLFGAGTAMCGFASSLETLIVARFIAGIGGGGLGITSSVIAADLFSLRQRSLLQGISAVFNGAGTGLGGPFGGYMADRFGWRWAFLAQLPLFAVSFALSTWNNKYYMPGRGTSAWDMTKRVDWAGSGTLLVAVLNLLLTLSFKYNSELPWHAPRVLATLILCCSFAVIFVLTQFYVSPEPILSRRLLRMRTPVIVGMNNFLVAVCNFGVTFYFPVWFETVALRSSAEAGLHLLPNALASSTGSLFAGWLMSRTGKYKTLSNVFGIVPACAAVGLACMHSATPEVWQWLSIVPLGFGNAVVFQTTLIALLASVGNSQVAVATGFASLFRCIGQVCGVAFGAAIFQSLLVQQLERRITGPEKAQIISEIRHDAKIVLTLPTELKNQARDSYAYALRAVFIFCAVCTFLSFLVRLPMPEHSLDDPPTASRPGSPADSDSDEEDKSDHDPSDDDGAAEAGAAHPPVRAVPVAPPPSSMRPRPRVRRFSTYETGDGFAWREAPARPKLPRRPAAVRSTRSEQPRPTGGRSRSRIREHHDGRGVLEEEAEMAFSLPTADPMFVEEREREREEEEQGRAEAMAMGRAGAHGGAGAGAGEGESGFMVPHGPGYGQHHVAFSLPPPSPAFEDWMHEAHHHHAQAQYFPSEAEEESAVVESGSGSESEGESEGEGEGEGEETPRAASPTSYF